MSPLVVHIVHRLDFGGLENGLVNLVNHMAPDAARHVIIALTEATDFARRVRRPDVQVIALHKRPGQDPAAYLRLYRLLRRLRPDIVHTRNVGTLDCQLIAFLAGAKRRIHGEHGWDVHDPDGRSRKYRLIRRVLRPFVHRFVALSGDLEAYLIDVIGVPQSRVSRICNGVDTERFAPPQQGPTDTGARRPFIIGSVTRFSPIKDPLNTVHAFIELKRRLAEDCEAKLMMIGDGPLLAAARAAVHEAGLKHAVCFPGAQDDPAEWYRKMSVFVLGSLREGISNTILEALASGLPVVACDVGGNAELVSDGVTGRLVPAGDSQALSRALETYVDDSSLTQAHGEAARAHAVDRFSLAEMVRRYTDLYSEAA